MAVDLDQELDALDTEDYEAFSKSRDSEPSEPTEEEEKTPAAGDKKPTSESDDAEEAEAGQTAEESETEDEEQQEEDEDKDLQDKDKPGKGKRGIDRRFGKLTGKIAALESRLAELGEKPTESGEEAEEEVASSTEKATEDPAEKLARPKLRDFEETETESAWDQYEKAIEAYEAKLEQKHADKIAAALTEQKEKLELEHGKALADAAWSKAASRFPDYNEVVLNDKVQISQAMESVMRMDADSGTALAYWLGKHPEESLRIAKSTLAGTAQREPTQAEWAEARVRASFELGQIRAQLNEQGKAKEPAKETPPKSPTAASPPTTKKITSASKPPTVIRGGTAPPQTDVLDEDGAADYNKWLPARERDLKRK